MMDTVTQEPLAVSADGNAGPYIMVAVDQLGRVTEILRQNRVPHWVDDDAISLNGKPEVAVINLGRSEDAARVQGLLDAED